MSTPTKVETTSAPEVLFRNKTQVTQLVTYKDELVRVEPGCNAFFTEDFGKKHAAVLEPVVLKK